MSKDYYKILGVGKNASADEVKAAFRKLAHEHHPDKAGGNAAKFKEALEAYQVLSDVEKRKQYDQFGTTFEQAQQNGGQGFGGFGQGFGNFNPQDFPDLSDILGGMFGFGGGRARGGKRKSRGRDIEKDVTLTFKESVFGINKTIELYSQVSCDRCGGSGGEPGAKISSCKTCGGSGQVRTVQRTVFGSFEALATCETCNGEGKKPEKECHRCRGIGVTRELRKFEVKIPAGVDDGGGVRISGAGEAAPHGGAAGELYLRIRVHPDDRFERHGYDIVSGMSIPFVTAALGGTVNVETVDGAVELKIPSGTQSAAVFRLRGKGVPQIHRASRGDHLIEVTIAVPKKLSKRQRKLLEDFDHEA